MTKTKEYTFSADLCPRVLGGTKWQTYLNFLMDRDGFCRQAPIEIDVIDGVSVTVTQDRKWIIRDEPIIGVGFETWIARMGGGA